MSILICHSDYWPGKLLISEDKLTLTVLDWETVRRGCGATDVPTFTAETVFLDILRGNRGFLGRMWHAYRDGVGAGMISLRFARRIAAHFGTHICSWTTQNDWGSREDIARRVQLV